MNAEDVRNAQEGDTAAFERLADGIAGRLHRTSYGILRDPDAARDATQQALLDVWRNLPQLRDPDRFEAWALRILVRVCHNEARRSRLVHAFSGPLDIHELPAADALGSVVDRERLDRGFRRLGLDQRAVVVLHHVLDMTLDEVAAALGIPIGTARSRHHRALAALRAAIAADDRVPVAATASREAAR